MPISTVCSVSEAEMDEAEHMVSAKLKHALELAHHNIARFHESQKFEGSKVETCPGVECWQESVAIRKVGLYIPGGTAPLFSTSTDACPHQPRSPGCEEIILCTPPNAEGKVNPAILMAAKIDRS